MNRATMQMTIGCVAGFGLGPFASWLLPHSPTSAASHSTVAAPMPATDSATEIDGPLASAYRTATGEQRWLLILSAAEHATPAEMSTLIRMVRDEPIAVRMLAERWAEQDPAGMFSSLYAD